MDKYIIKTLEAYYSGKDVKIDDIAADVLQEFVYNSNVMLLQGYMESEHSITFSTKLRTDKLESIIFYKTSNKVLSENQFAQNINIITLSNSPAESLYLILRQIYIPLLSEGNDLINNKLQKNFFELESNLRILTHGNTDSENFQVILSIEDEIEYWNNICQDRKTSKKKIEAATELSELFGEILEELRILQTATLVEIKEVCENVCGLLDDVWRHNSCSYTEDRMKHTLDVIGHIIRTRLQDILSGIDIWMSYEDSRDSTITTQLGDSVKCMETWTSGCMTLTEAYWPNHVMHPWQGKPYIPGFCTLLLNRLKEVYDIKCTFSQLNKLLSTEERTELNTNKLFDSFKGNNNIWSNVSTFWQNAVAKFTMSLRPVETKIAEKLKPRLHNASIKQTLYEFMRYKILIQRPHVKDYLYNDLDLFLTSLIGLIKDIQSQMDVHNSETHMYSPPEMSLIVQKVQWAKQMESKVKDINDCAKNYLKEFEKSVEVTNLSTKLMKDLKNMYTQFYEDWSRDLQVQVKDGTLRLSVDKPVVQFSSTNNMMVVQFNPRLVSLETEVRAMAAMGLPAPALVKDALDNVARVLHYARSLQQVASFHNTLGERMILSTRPLMLEAALHLSSLVREQRAVYWDNVPQLANYTDMLKDAVLKLETQNSYLTSQHVALRGIVESLLETDLLVKQSEWKRKINQMRDIIEKVESKGYKNTELWRSHWDWQLYKVLECQYVKTLLSLHKHFPHVRVELVLRGHEIRTQPPLEEVRAHHYQQLRRLVSLPAHFAGLQDTIFTDKSVFSTIIDKHSWLANGCVSVVERGMSGVRCVCARWARRAGPAAVTHLPALCREHLTCPADWEYNFKACKAYGQAVARMAFEDEKVEWISIGTESLRREFESSVRSLWGALMSSLQDSCREHAGLLDTYMASANLALGTAGLARNAKELGEVSAKHRALEEKMPEMEKIVEDLKKKGHMLQTWGGDASVDSTIQEWVRTREMILTQRQMFLHQAETVKSSLLGEWDNLTTRVESWASLYAQTKSGEGGRLSNMADRCARVFDVQAQWELYVAERNELLEECSKFGLNVKQNDIWNDTEKMITEDVQLWTVFKEYQNDLEALGEQEWIVFHKKLYQIDEFVTKWKGRLEPYTPVTLFLEKDLDNYTDLAPILRYVRGNDFTERHWREIFGLLDMEHRTLDLLQVKHFLGAAHNIKKHAKELLKISSAATSEAAVRGALTELELWFAGARLGVLAHRDKSGRHTSIVGDLKVVTTKVEEQQWVVSGLGDEAGVWGGRLARARTLLLDMHHAQRRWLYMEPILSNDDGELGARFRKVDNGFRQVGKILETDPRLSTLLQSTRLQPMLDTILDQLTACQTALNDYIDDKRKIFPRFYFLSDDDLLELLGQARSGADGRVLVIQNHLKKLFPGISGVKLGPDNMSITALCSDYGEIFCLEHPVDIDNAVEVWLKNLEEEMRSSLKTVALKCINSTKQNLDVFSLPTQIICLAQNIRFTQQTEKAIVNRELQKLKANYEVETKSYSEIDLEEESEKMKRQALILQCVYYTFVIQELIDNNVTSTNEWIWHKQLRFYLVNSKDVVARMGIAELSYSYEYLGVNTGQFVRTEVADQCFLILTQAFQLGLVGNPFGPAGTGKTESVKALGALVGRLVLVFNCDEAMDEECMCRLLTGVGRCGAWGCFDEYNRLSADTLDAVADTIVRLLAAANNTADNTVVLNGKQVEVSPWCAVAATMNPLGGEYGGRRALSGRVSRALRPVGMSVTPRGDLLRLAHHSLLAATRTPHAHTLAQLLYSLYCAASDLLSSQRHYDWGLRALKSTIGSLVSALNPPAGSVTKSPRDPRAILRDVLRRNNLPKLTRYDAYFFEQILSVVFKDVPEEESEPDPLVKVLENSCRTLNLIRNDSQIQKCVELHEQMKQRMGVVIVGDPGSGKTTIRDLLKQALTQEGQKIVEYVMNPKALSRSGLLGHIDGDTRQWTDGLISAAALEISTQPDDVWSWVVCDGELDPEWVEALNSVLDDNRLLSLPSGCRIHFRKNVNFVFETHSLQHASPATVSRLGVILLGEHNSCTEEVLSLWIENNKQLESDTLNPALPLLQQAVQHCLQWKAKHTTDFISNVYDVSLVKQIVVHFEYLMKDTKTNMSPEELVGTALYRGVICNLKENAVETFENDMSKLVSVGMCECVSESEWRGEARQVYMSGRVARHVPTLVANSHVLITGPPASAKFALAECVLKETDNAVIININCTPNLQPTDIIAELKRHNVVQSCSGHPVRPGRVRAGPVLLLRWLDRAGRDAWGCSAVEQLLLQLIDRGGFWSVGGGGNEGCAWWSCGVRVVTTCGARGGVGPRLVARLANLTLTEPEDDELQEIITHYLKQNFEYKKIGDKEIGRVARNMLAVYKEVTETFTSKKHYEWNASDLKKWCDNMIWYKPKTLDDLIPAIINEAIYIFRDRLVSENERNEYDSIIQKQMKLSQSQNLYYATKLRGSGVYMEPIDYADWSHNTQKVINQCLAEHDYNVFGESGAEVCKELSSWCAAIGRTTNGGVSVCVGAEGCGRRAAAHIQAAILSATTLLVQTHTEFQAMFKNATTLASDDNSRALLVLCPGVANLNILANIEEYIAAHRGKQSDGNTNTIPKLGIVICLDKNQEDLTELFDKFPFLYKNSHLVWQEEWCQDTLHQMPTMVIQRLMKEDIAEGVQDGHESIPVEDFVHIYNNPPQEWLRAPYRYVCMLKKYFYIVRRKRSSLLKRQKMLTAGVSAIARAGAHVTSLSECARRQTSALSVSVSAASDTLRRLTRAARAAHTDTAALTLLRDNVRLEEAKLQQQKAQIEAELATVEPVIAAARAAVGEIKNEALTEYEYWEPPLVMATENYVIHLVFPVVSTHEPPFVSSAKVRSLRAPPDVVRDILEGVLRLMGIADTSWHSMKTFLAKRGVKEDIKCLDASQISPEALQSVEELLRTRGDSFTERAARRASAACAPLAAWVAANLAYGRAALRVRPLLAQQRGLHQNLKEAEAKLESLTGGVSGSEARVKELSDQLAEHSRTTAALELAAQKAAEELKVGEKLLKALEGESEAWAKDLEQITKEISSVGTRSVLAAAYVVYLPEVTEPVAREYLSKWSELVGFEDSEFSVLNFLVSTEKQVQWEADGLPQDSTALKNALIIDQALEKWQAGLSPYIVDPDGSAYSWLQNSMQADFVDQHSEHLNTVLNNAARLNRVVVVTSAVAGVMPLPHGARVMFHSRDAGMTRRHVPTLATLLFVVTVHGLTDQLVQAVLQRKDPQTFGKIKELKLKVATLQKEQYELQEKLLEALLNGADIMKESALVEALGTGRESVGIVVSELSRATGDARSGMVTWGDVGRRGAALGMAAGDARCTLTATQLAQVFVDTCMQSDNIDHTEIIKNFTRKIIDRILLSIHRNDKYVIVLYLLKHVYSDIITEQLWKVFIESDDVMMTEDPDDINILKSKFKWLPETGAKKLAVLQRVCPELYNKLNLENIEFWSEVQRSPNMAAVNKLGVGPFETVVTVSTLIPELLYRAIVTFVDRILGGEVCSVGVVDRAVRHAGHCPILVRGPHAADLLKAASPTATLMSASEALAALHSVGGSGWLMVSVRDPHLPALLTHISTAKEQSDYIVWIIAEDQPVSPTLTAACLEVLLEPPQGIRSNVLNTLSVWENRPCSVGGARALAELAMLHAVVQERRDYIPGGWSQWYEFSWGDVSAVASAIELCRCSGGAAGLATALYGGRLVTDADRRALADLVGVGRGRHHTAGHNSLQEYMQVFEQLPAIDTPDMLHLPANCRQAWEAAATDHITHRLKVLNSQVGPKCTKEDSMASVKSLMALWKKLVSGNPLLKGELPDEKFGTGWWWCVVLGEARHAQAAARALTAALMAARRGDIHVQQIPAKCAWAWPGPPAPSRYVRELAARVTAAARALHGYRPGDSMPPHECDLRNFLRPQRLLSALRTHSHTDLVWLPDQHSSEGLSVVVSGVMLRGARWNRGALAGVSATDPAYTPAVPRLGPTIPRVDPTIPGVGLTLVPLLSPEGHTLAEIGAPGEVPHAHGPALFIL